MTASLPTRERELKHQKPGETGVRPASLPTRERELKRGHLGNRQQLDGRSPRGSAN